jgi:tetratricopeptide (TPR) repeat protein
MIGIILILALVLATFSGSNSRRATMTYSLTCVLLTIAIFGTWQRSLVWNNTETLFSNVLTTYPNSHIAHTKIGALLADKGKITQAKERYETSLAIRENERALYNIGIIYIQENRLYEALEVNRKAVELNPHYAPAHTNAGFLEWKLHNTEQAIFHFEEAIAYDPFAIDARVNLAVLLTKEGEFDRVRKLINEVLAIDPTNKDAGTILEKLN